MFLSYIISDPWNYHFQVSQIIIPLLIFFPTIQKYKNHPSLMRHTKRGSGLDSVNEA